MVSLPGGGGSIIGDVHYHMLSYYKLTVIKRVHWHKDRQKDEKSER